MQVRIVNNITKEYPDMFKVIIYKEPRAFVVNDEGRVKRDRSQVDLENYVPSQMSLSRTKCAIRDVVMCNEFDLFCTFTFDPDKVDSFNLICSWHVLSRWLSRQRNNSKEAGKELKYFDYS